MKLVKTVGIRSWVVEWYDHMGRRRRWTAFTDRRASEQFGRKLDQIVAARKEGEGDHAAWQRFTEMPLDGFPDRVLRKLGNIGLIHYVSVLCSLDAIRERYGRHLKAKECCVQHVKATLQHVRKCMSAIDAIEVDHITATAVEDHLKWYRDNGVSRRTSNDRLAAMKGFCNWMVREGEISESPIRHLGKLNEAVDRRRWNEPLAPDQVGTLLFAVLQYAHVVGGCPCDERYWIYRLAVETGFRASELRSLRREDFNCCHEPSVTAQAAYTKGRKMFEMPLSIETAKAIGTFFGCQRPQGPAFPNFPVKTNAVFQQDLECAGIAVKVDANRSRTFHGLRHTFITNLSGTTSSLADLQALARHSTAELTARYAHPRVANMRGAIEALPGYEQNQTLERKNAK